MRIRVNGIKYEECEKLAERCFLRRGHDCCFEVQENKVVLKNTINPEEIP
jgi:hypothetical protein